MSMRMNLRPALLLRLLSRALALAAPVVLVAAVYFAAVDPALVATDEARTRLMDQRELQARYAALAEQGGAVDTELLALEAAQSESGRFLKGGTGPLAAAALQQMLTALINDAGGNTRSVAGSHDSADGALERVTAVVMLSADIGQLVQILHQVETSEPLLFIDRLTVTGQMHREEGKMVSARRLNISLGVSGYRLADVVEHAL